MSLLVNNNLIAAGTARNLNAHYGRLSSSVRRLSTGLRVNNASDDAAGLAIRELMRADAAALNQGVRNANDAISLIQVADGSLSIIDEKLIRMKELAEQAATGTYNSTQRLMIESEYQQMASEITRIANATDFNGIKLLDGSLTGAHDGSHLKAQGKLKVHFGTANDSAEDYYYLEIGECTSQALGLGNASTWQDVQRRAVQAFRESLEQQIKAGGNGGIPLTEAEKAAYIAAIDGAADVLNDAINNATDPLNAWRYWAAPEDHGFMDEGKQDIGELMDEYLSPIEDGSQVIMDGLIDVIRQNAPPIKPGETIGLNSPPATYNWRDGYITKVQDGVKDYARQQGLDVALVRDQVNIALGMYPQDSTMTDKTYDRFMIAHNGAISIVANDPKLKAEMNKKSYENLLQNPGAVEQEMQVFWDGLRDSQRQKLQYAWGQAALYNLANANPAREPGAYGIEAGDFGFPDAGMLAKALDDMQRSVSFRDFAGYTVETQEDAQKALGAINNAIASKDQIRAHLGATQNRLENTVTNLTIQAENMQAAESRISDVDVATEMTGFVRNQILSQSAAAMLGQANSLPQMALQLLS